MHQTLTNATTALYTILFLTNSVTVNVQSISISLHTNCSNPQRSRNYHYSLRNSPEERSSPLVSSINTLTCTGDTKGLHDATLNEVIVGECAVFIYLVLCYS
jgi:hypothetical protein